MGRAGAYICHRSEWATPRPFLWCFWPPPECEQCESFSIWNSNVEISLANSIESFIISSQNLLWFNKLKVSESVDRWILTGVTLRDWNIEFCEVCALVNIEQCPFQRCTHTQPRILGMSYIWMSRDQYCHRVHKRVFEAEKSVENGIKTINSIRIFCALKSVVGSQLFQE